MLNFKIVLPILGLLLSFVTMAADNSIINDHGKTDLTGNTYVARVIGAKAIVYADENMLSPLGYIANGKAISVGNPRRMNRELVPLIVYGRLAFIEIKDIRYEDSADEEVNAKRGAPREHNVDITIQQPEERLSENNSVYFSLGRYTAGNDVKTTFLEVDEADEKVMSGFQFQFIHRQPTSRFFWGAGIDYASVSTSNMKFAYWMLNPTFGYTPISNPLFSVDIYASLDLATNLEYRVDSNFEEEPSGYIWGPQVSARVVFLPNKKYHGFGGISFRKYTVSDLTPLKDNNGKEIQGIGRVGGLGLFIGLSMEFK